MVNILVKNHRGCGVSFGKLFFKFRKLRRNILDLLHLKLGIQLCGQSDYRHMWSTSSMVDVKCYQICGLKESYTS